MSSKEEDNQKSAAASDQENGAENASKSDESSDLEAPPEETSSELKEPPMPPAPEMIKPEVQDSTEVDSPGRITESKSQSTPKQKQTTEEKASPILNNSPPVVQNQETSAGQASNNRSRLVLYFSICFFLVIAAQGAVIGVLVARDNKDDITSDKAIEGLDDSEPPSESPSVNPSASPSVRNPTSIPTATAAPVWAPAPPPSYIWRPTTAPYNPPTYTNNPGTTNPTFDGFVKIADLSGVSPLRTVSACVSCTQTIKLPFGYKWRGKYSISDLAVSSNGYVELFGSCGNKTRAECATIHVVSMDLDPSLSSDVSIWTYDATSDSVAIETKEAQFPNGAFVISWEDVPVDNNVYVADDDGREARVSGQVHLYPDGRIDICWGQSSLPSAELHFQSAVWDAFQRQLLVATGPNFQPVTGFTKPFNYPTNECQRLMSDFGVPPSVLYSKEMKPLASNSEAYILKNVSSSDGVEKVSLRTPIRWVGDTKIQDLIVSSDGEIRIGGCPMSMMWTECGRVSVAATRLDPTDSGAVWFWDGSRSGAAADYIVSWEDVALDGLTGTSINAQASFFPNGTIELCWGEGTFDRWNIQFKAGLFDPRFRVEIPAWGEGFDPFGNSQPGWWPTNLCQSFQVDSSSPQSSPTLSPTFQPTLPLSIPPCVPTAGYCASTYSELSALLLEAKPGDTVGLCAVDISVTYSLRLSQANVTVCCVRYPQCLLTSATGSRQIMSVTGTNTTLVGISFQNGGTRYNGGNLAIFNGGYHKIDYCKFYNGFAGLHGGNLHVFRAKSISISNSHFEEGKAVNGGGGASFTQSPSVVVKSCTFHGNEGGENGGALHFFNEAFNELGDAEQEVSITGSYMEKNTALRGGGFLIEKINYVQLKVFDSSIDSNYARLLGGGGVVVNITSVSAAFNGNMGQNSDGPNRCSDFYFVKNDWKIGEPFCYGATEDFELPLAPTLSSAPVKSPAPINEPSLAPTSYPTKPLVSLPTPTCVSSMGTCATSEGHLKDMLSKVKHGDTISICGAMGVNQTILVSQWNVTMCCEKYPGCSFNSMEGSSPIMLVTGGNFTLVGIQFQRGYSSIDGGNLAITGLGYHTIENCTFLGGRADRFGGNLYVGNAAGVSLSGSILDSGITGSDGGGAGAAFENTPMVEIFDSSIRGNSATVEGGGLFLFYSIYTEQEGAELELLLSNTDVLGNFAPFGGGLHIRDTSLRLSILDSYFGANRAVRGGAAASVRRSSIEAVVLLGNQGWDNDDNSGSCDGFYVYNSIVENLGIVNSTMCFDVNSNTTLPFSNSTMVPTFLPTMKPTVTPAPSLTSDNSCVFGFRQLTAVLKVLQPNDVVSVCAGSFQATGTLEITQRNVTLYCSDSSIGCALKSTGSSRLLLVTGEDVIVRGISFLGGASASNGGNVLVAAKGYHAFVDCDFFVGKSLGYGGGLAVTGADRIDINGSSFQGSSSVFGGGGFAVLDTAKIVMSDVSFRNNTGGSQGGGLYFSFSELDVKFSLLILASEFLGNQANLGGGIMASELGNIVDIGVYESTFSNNIGRAGIILGDEFLDIHCRFYRNSGLGNFGGDNSLCNDFEFKFSDSDLADWPRCNLVSVNFDKEYLADGYTLF